MTRWGENRLFSAMKRSCEKGQALVELSIALTFLTILMLGLYDVSRAIRAKSIITNMGREGANLIARANVNLSGNDAQDFANVMDLIGKTAQPLDMVNKGMMYLTEVSYGSATSGQANKITTHVRWSRGTPVTENQSKLYGTNAYSSNVGTATTVYVTPANLGGLTLTSGKVTYVMEIYYQYNSIFLGTRFSPLLYTKSIF